jgi:hypothetical protein
MVKNKSKVTKASSLPRTTEVEELTQVCINIYIVIVNQNNNKNILPYISLQCQLIHT